MEEVRIEKQAQKDKYEVDVAGLERLLHEAKTAGEDKLRDEIDRLHEEHQEFVRRLRAEEEQKRTNQEQVWLYGLIG